MQGKEGYGGEAEADGDQARIKREYNPATLQLGGPQLLEAMKDMINIRPASSTLSGQRRSSPGTRPSSAPQTLCSTWTQKRNFQEYISSLYEVYCIFCKSLNGSEKVPEDDRDLNYEERDTDLDFFILSLTSM